MEQYNISRGNSFYAIGLSYKKADAKIRGHFSLDTDAKTALLNQAKNEGLESLVVTSTCNRTCLLYTSPSPRDKRQSRMPSSA